jgi:hypothetical protein
MAAKIREGMKVTRLNQQKPRWFEAPTPAGWLRICSSPAHCETVSSGVNGELDDYIIPQKVVYLTTK